MLQSDDEKRRLAAMDHAFRELGISTKNKIVIDTTEKHSQPHLYRQRGWGMNMTAELDASGSPLSQPQTGEKR